MKIKLPILICLIGLTLVSTSQSTSNSYSRKWSYGIVFSPAIAYRAMSASDESAERFLHLDNEYDSPKFGFSSGFSIQYKLNIPVELGTGLFYTDKGFRYEFDEFVTPGNQPDPLIPESSITTYSFRYLTIPAKINWILPVRKMKMFLSAGLSGNFFLDAVYKNKLTYDDRIEKHTFHEDDSYFKKFHVDILAGFETEIPVSEQLHLRIGPYYQRGITPMSDTLFKLFGWSAGINTAVYFR
jgi:hypothetical protein